jgi:hypothetical protein
MMGQVSFPSSAEIGVRPYTRESLLKYGYEEDEESLEEGDEGWDEEGRRSWSNESEDFGGEEVGPLPEDDDSDDNDEE